MNRVACESKLSSVVRSYMHVCLGKWVATVRAVVKHGLPTHLVQKLNVSTVSVITELKFSRYMYFIQIT